MRTNENAGESAVGKKQPAGPAENQNDPGRAARIVGSSSSTTSLTQAQRERNSSYVRQHRMHRANTVNFSIAIGAAVPRQVQLRSLPAELASILQGYSGDEYALVRDQLVVVDSKSRRIVAIIPNIALRFAARSRRPRRADEFLERRTIPVEQPTKFDLVINPTTAKKPCP